MFKLMKIFDDPSPGLINLRFIKHLMDITEYSEFEDDEKEKLFQLLVLVGKKLAMVWLHHQEYKKLEEFQISKAKEKPITNDQKIMIFDNPQNLYFEFDEFLVQVKSCLDYLVKLPAIVFGHNTWSLRTFKGKGRDVIKALQNNIPDKNTNTAKSLISFIEKNQSWLEATINARDKINHFFNGGIDFKYFTIYCLKDKEAEKLQTPMWSNEQTIKDFMQVVWNNLFSLCEFFAGSVIHFRIKKGYAFYYGSKEIDSLESPWKVTTNEKMMEIVTKPGWEKIE